MSNQQIPPLFTPEEVADRFGVSLRRLKAEARASGNCRVIGNRIRLTAGDIEALLESWRPAPTRQAPPPRSVLQAPRDIPQGDYAALIRLRAKTKR